jgi:hypothetical protein
MWKNPVIRAKIVNALKGRTVSDETRKKISEANSGEKNPNYGKHITEEHKKAISNAVSGEKNHMYGLRGEKSPLYGIKRSDETKKKMSDSQKQLYSSGKRKALKGKDHPMYGKPKSAETIEKLKEAAKNRQPMSDDTKKKIGDSVRGEKNGRYGKHCSDEYKEKIRQTLIKTNEAKRYIFKIYAEHGGKLSYKEFFKAVKNGSIGFFNQLLSVYTY